MLTSSSAIAKRQCSRVG